MVHIFRVANGGGGGGGGGGSEGRIFVPQRQLFIVVGVHDYLARVFFCRFGRAARHALGWADPVYMRERLGVELELCPNECDDGTVAGRGKARTPCPRCRVDTAIFSSA